MPMTPAEIEHELMTQAGAIAKLSEAIRLLNSAVASSKGGVSREIGMMTLDLTQMEEAIRKRWWP